MQESAVCVVAVLPTHFGPPVHKLYFPLQVCYMKLYAPKVILPKHITAGISTIKDCAHIYEYNYIEMCTCKYIILYCLVFAEVLKQILCI